MSDLLHDSRPLERSYYRRVQLAILAAITIHGAVMLLAPPYVPRPYRLESTPLRLVTAGGIGLAEGARSSGNVEAQSPATTSAEAVPRSSAPILTEQLRFTTQEAPSPQRASVGSGRTSAGADAAGVSGAAGEGESDEGGSPSVFYAFDTPPRILERVVPEYSAAAKAQGAEGTVVLNANVDERGRVIRVWVAQSNAPEILVEAAVDALYRFRFTPGSQQGIPVKCTVAVPFNFRLDIHL